MSPKQSTLLNAFVLAGAGAVAFLLLAFNGKDLPFLKKFTAEFSFYRFDQVRDHEVLQPDHIGRDKKKLALLGSCMLGTLHCVADHRGNDTYPECAASELLEQEMVRRGHKDWRVANLSIPNFTLGHSLNILLWLLDDPTFPVFVWENDLRKDESIFKHKPEELMTFLPYLYKKLLEMRERHPELTEVQELLAQVRERYPQMQAPEDSFLGHWQRSGTSVLKGTGDNLKQVFSALAGRRLGEVARVLNQNTNYLRVVQSKLYKVMGTPMPQGYYEGYEQEIAASKAPYQPDLYSAEKMGVERVDQKEQVLALRLMGKLAALYGKKIYFYVGPPAACEVNGHFRKNFSGPLAKAVADLPAIHMMDISNLEMVPRRDSFNCINFSVLGKKKITDEIYRRMSANGDFMGSGE